MTSLHADAPDRRPVVLAVQSDPTDPPLLVGEWLEESGLQVDVLEACFDQLVPPSVPEGVDGLLVMGGVMGANDDDVAPWLPALRSMIADAVDRDVPMLGLCLGGQLLAASTGGRVALAPITEIGLVSVQRTVDGLLDPVIGQVVPVEGADVPATQWHQDHVAELPADAVVLMTNPACAVQAFRVGATAYGLQMHPELDARTFASWVTPDDEALLRSGRDPRAATDEVTAAEASLIAAWRPAARAWADLVWAHARDRVDEPASQA